MAKSAWRSDGCKGPAIDRRRCLPGKAAIRGSWSDTRLRVACSSEPGRCPHVPRSRRAPIGVGADSAGIAAASVCEGCEECEAAD